MSVRGGCVCEVGVSVRDGCACEVGVSVRGGCACEVGVSVRGGCVCKRWVCPCLVHLLSLLCLSHSVLTVVQSGVPRMEEEGQPQLTSTVLTQRFLIRKWEGTRNTVKPVYAVDI